MSFIVHKIYHENTPGMIQDALNEIEEPIIDWAFGVKRKKVG